MLALRRCLLRLEDWARTGSLGRLRSLALLAKSRVLSPRQRVSALALYLVTWHPARRRRDLVKKAMALAARQKKALFDSATIARSILLKRAVSNTERGVLLVSFEPELATLAGLASLAELERRYAIVFLPTWQPFYSEALFAFAARARRPYWIMPSATPDQHLCGDLGPLCRPLPFQASSWVSQAQYESITAPKTIDLLMVANFSPYKRHWRLFEALQNLPPSLTVVLAGRPFSGRTAASLAADADAFGVRDRIQIREDPSDQELAALLASARVFCALSHKEGSYIAVAEALMADTAVAMFANAIVGSKEYISPATGWLLEPERPLAPQLLQCLDRAGQLHPRRWAKANISAEINVARFNEVMWRDALQLGETWTVDLTGFFCRHFEFEYVDSVAETDFRAEYGMLAMEFGLTVTRQYRADGLSHESARTKG
jgi:glycosyltransferase involved in cell wall biosynthesis